MRCAIRCDAWRVKLGYSLERAGTYRDSLALDSITSSSAKIVGAALCDAWRVPSSPGESQFVPSSPLSLATHRALQHVVETTHKTYIIKLNRSLNLL